MPCAPNDIRLSIDSPRATRILIDEIKLARLRRGKRVTLRELIAEGLAVLAKAERQR
ncbi:MAG TPA: hypothetical protein VHZ95_09050 [Polyangiales bacterium]|nr:hypothetical protein [Polyangiales bacterium]